MDLNRIVQNFLPNHRIKSIEPFGKGHINSTYKVVLSNSVEYILQKLNTQVFTNPKRIIENHCRIQDSIQFKEIEIPVLIRTTQGTYLYVDQDNNTWRMMNFIKDSYSIEVVENEVQAFEAGRGFGWFLNACSNLESSSFHEVIKDFHSIQFRYQQLNKAVQQDKAKRVYVAKELIKFYKEKEGKLIDVEELIKTQKIPLRVVHNDTKINNLLFRNKKSIAVIDLDTAGPGSVLFDYGDAIRTITNSAAEDEKDLTRINFNIRTFKCFTKAYLEETRSILTEKEKETLYIAPFYMTVIMGIRFLADYLNGDVYYKTEYNEHNLIRSHVQKALIEKMDSNLEQIKYTITGLMAKSS